MGIDIYDFQDPRTRTGLTRRVALDLILVEASHNGALGLRYQYWLFYTRKVAQSVAFRISLNKNNFDSKSTGGRARRIEIVLWWNRIRTEL